MADHHSNIYLASNKLTQKELMLKHYQNLSEITFEFPDPVIKEMDKLYYKKGQIVYQEGSTPLGAYFIQNGKIKITKSSTNGKTAIVRIAVKDEVINYTDVFSQTSYSTSASALEDSELLFIPRVKFWDMVREQTDLCDQLLQKLAMDKKIMEARIVDFAYKPVRGRLADALITLDKKFNGHNKHHRLEISRTDLACYTGTARETVNRILSEFKRDKLVSTNSNHEIDILDEQGLMKISEMYD